MLLIIKYSEWELVKTSSHFLYYKIILTFNDIIDIAFDYKNNLLYILDNKGNIIIKELTLSVSKAYTNTCNKLGSKKELYIIKYNYNIICRYYKSNINSNTCKWNSYIWYSSNIKLHSNRICWKPNRNNCNSRRLCSTSTTNEQYCSWNI